MAVLVNSYNAVTLDFDPEWDYQEKRRKVQENHRTTDGSLYMYKFEEYRTFSVPVDHFTQTQADYINDWWNLNEELYFTDPSSDVYVVRITNDKTPIGKRVRPYLDRFMGTIELSEF